jgi:hypothetical protein
VALFSYIPEGEVPVPKKLNAFKNGIAQFAKNRKLTHLLLFLRLLESQMQVSEKSSYTPSGKCRIFGPGTTFLQC